MAEFHKAWVNVVVDENLYGKYGYFADNIDTLIAAVTDDDYPCFYGRLSHDESTNASLPFVKEENNRHFRFFYHDPGLPQLPTYYRTRRITNRELSLWLAHGNGEACCFSDEHSPTCFTEFRYHPDEGDKPASVRAGVRIMIRRWYESEWHEPTADYIGLGGQG